MVTTESNEPTIVVSNIKLDSHVDTIVAGENGTILSFTDRAYDVEPYTDKYEPKKGIPVFHAETGYTSDFGRNYILILNEALCIPELRHSLINPIG